MNKTSQDQFDALADFMEQNPDVARGIRHNEANKITKEKYNQLWAELAEKLDQIGPTKRTIVQWQKVYYDIKRSAKSKLYENRKEVRATGGGLNKQKRLSAIEDRIAGILSLEKSADPIGRAFGLNGPRSGQNSMIGDRSDDSDENDSVTISPQPSFSAIQFGMMSSTPTTSSSKKRRLGKQSSEDSKELMLRDQTEYLKQIMLNSNAVVEYSRKEYELKEEIEREKIALKKQKENRKIKELELQIETINVKKKKLDLLERSLR